MSELPITDVRNSVDRVIHAYQGRLTHGFAPASMLIAYLDWLVHLLNSPGKVGEMLENASVKGRNFSAWMSRAATGADTPAIIEPLPQDRRFSNEAWRRWPFYPMYRQQAS
jgi:polyhydroxyalkanoate synthase